MLIPSVLVESWVSTRKNAHVAMTGQAVTPEQESIIRQIVTAEVNALYSWILTAQVNTIVTVGGVTAGVATSAPTPNIGTIS